MMKPLPPRTVALSAGIICLLVYLGTLSCDFVNSDDPTYVQYNISIRNLDSNLLRWAFTDFTTAWWMPLTWISFALDYRIWGLNPAGYHLTNALLHAVNTGLVVLIANRLYRNALPDTDSSSVHSWVYPATLLLAGLLWALHPLRVESVAWVTERKDVLNGLFSLGSILCYLRYAQNRPANDFNAFRDRDYLFSLILLLCSLMAKQVSVIIPAMLLIADWYPLGRLRKGNILPVLAEKIPHFLLSAAMSIFTVAIAARYGFMATTLSLGQKIIISGNAIVEYCRLMLFPVGIIPVYIIPDPIPAAYTVKAVAVVLICFAVYAGKKFRFLPATWLSFLLPLVPVLAFFQNGIQAYAARFTYLPSVVPSIAAAVFLTRRYTFLKGQAFPYRHRLVTAAIVSLLVFYGVTTERLIGVWKNSGTMWSRVIKFQPYERAYFFRADYYAATGKYDKAIDDYTTCLEIAAREGIPDIFNLYAFRGESLHLAGRYNDAAQDFTAALELYPHPLYYYHRALAREAMGDKAGAEKDFIQAGPENRSVTWLSRDGI